ncbi:MAG: patatin-like protein [Alphaproteobacteria bacterium]|nr:patatin-like protein [Alphaproteobacteria bacterium]
MREKELRLALVCYGGISLAVYMHGIVKEVWKLLRASRAVRDGPSAVAALRDSEAAYAELLTALDPEVRLRVLVDIVAGASAGGINGVHLAHAIAGGHDMECLRDLWLGKADVDVLLDPDAAPRSAMTKLYARPLIWLLERNRGERIVSSIADVEVRREVRGKLSRFIRSRWFEPPFSGPGFAALLHDSLGTMTRDGAPSLLPPALPLDLFVTVTDFRGYPERLAVNSPPEIIETEHRIVLSFRDEGGARNGAGACAPRSIGSRAALTFAARATASFPGAFPPTSIEEIDAIADRWDDRDAFVARAFPNHAAAGMNPLDAPMIDGSVLANAPFGPAIDAVRDRPAHREVDRRFVYIDPTAGARLVGPRGGKRADRPGFFTTILRSLADIPREQPIRDAIETIDALSRRVRRLRYIVAGLRPTVDTAIERELGRTLLLYRPTSKRLTDWRSRVQSAAAREAGFAYPAYAHLKLSQVVEWLAEAMAVSHRGDLWRAVRADGVDAVTTPAYIAFLRRFDLPYRVRRLRFLIRRVNELIADADPGTRAALEAAKAGLYGLVGPYLERRGPAFAAKQSLPADPAAALDAFGAALDLTTLDAATDAALVALLGDEALDRRHRRALLLAYLGFPFFDIATLPLLQGEGLDEFDEIKVDRISPADASDLSAAGVGVLKGIGFNGFGAFFSRAWRENDYLWGRLHGAERLIDIVLSTLPPGVAPPADVDALRTAAYRAILTAERPHLLRALPLIDELEQRLA